MQYAFVFSFYTRVQTHSVSERIYDLWGPLLLWHNRHTHGRPTQTLRLHKLAFLKGGGRGRTGEVFSPGVRRWSLKHRTVLTSKQSAVHLGAKNHWLSRYKTSTHMVKDGLLRRTFRKLTAFPQLNSMRWWQQRFLAQRTTGYSTTVCRRTRFRQ